jgi:hypothetical protein
MWVVSVVSVDACLQGSLRKTGQLLFLLFRALPFRLELWLADKHGANGRAPQRGHNRPYWIGGGCRFRVHAYIRSPFSETYVYCTRSWGGVN